jgi:adenosylmethionine-8-amino-7-oxononanoate aminotransferase
MVLLYWARTALNGLKRRFPARAGMWNMNIGYGRKKMADVIGAQVGLGRIVALCHRSSASHQITTTAGIADGVQLAVAQHQRAGRQARVADRRSGSSQGV